MRNWEGSRPRLLREDSASGVRALATASHELMSAYRPCAAKPPVPHYSYPSGLLLIPQCSAVRIAPPAKQDAAASAEGAPSSVSHQQQLRQATATGSRGRAGGASPRPGRIAEILGRGGAARSPAAAGRPAPGAWRPASGWPPLGAALSGAAADREGDGGEPRRDLNRGGGREGVRRRWRQAPAPAFFCSLSLSPFPVWPWRCLVVSSISSTKILTNN